MIAANFPRIEQRDGFRPRQVNHRNLIRSFASDKGAFVVRAEGDMGRCTADFEPRPKLVSMRIEQADA